MKTRPKASRKMQKPMHRNPLKTLLTKLAKMLAIAMAATRKKQPNEDGGIVERCPLHSLNPELQEQTMSAEKTKDEFEEKAEITAKMALPADAPEPDYNDLPDELKKQLIGYEDIELENQLFDIVKTMTKSVITVDKIIVALYHRHKKVVDRNKVLRTLNAMAAAGKIAKHASPRGYSLPGSSQ